VVSSFQILCLAIRILKNSNVLTKSPLHGGVESVYQRSIFATVLGKRRIISSKINGIDRVTECPRYLKRRKNTVGVCGGGGGVSGVRHARVRNARERVTLGTRWAFLSTGPGSPGRGRGRDSERPISECRFKPSTITVPVMKGRRGGHQGKIITASDC
jgi:hypothetical protein